MSMSLPHGRLDLLVSALNNRSPSRFHQNQSKRNETPPFDISTDHLVTTPPFSLKTMMSAIATVSFPTKLHLILAERSFESIVSWLPDGLSWAIVDLDNFARHVIPLLLPASQGGTKPFDAFAPLLREWRFQMVAVDSSIVVYKHENFVRDSPQLSRLMRPSKQEFIPLKGYNQLLRPGVVTTSNDLARLLHSDLPVSVRVPEVPAKPTFPQPQRSQRNPFVHKELLKSRYCNVNTMPRHSSASILSLDTLYHVRGKAQTLRDLNEVASTKCSKVGDHVALKNGDLIEKSKATKKKVECSKLDKKGDQDWILQYCKPAQVSLDASEKEQPTKKPKVKSGSKTKSAQPPKKKKKRKWLPPLGPKPSQSSDNYYDWVHTNPEAFATLTNPTKR